MLGDKLKNHSFEPFCLSGEEDLEELNTILQELSALLFAGSSAAAGLYDILRASEPDWELDG